MIVDSQGMKDTSLMAYIEVHPTLGDRQARVLSLLERGERLTNMEIAQALGWSINRVTPRVKELRELGLVKLDGYRECSVTGRTACLWTVTDGRN